MSDEMTLQTAPTSKRFPTTNQAKACYMYYNSWHQCKYDYSEEEPQCAKLKSWAWGMCPQEWVRARWHWPCMLQHSVQPRVVTQSSPSHERRLARAA